MESRLLREMEHSGLLRISEIRQEDSGLHFLLCIRSKTDAEMIRQAALEQGVRVMSLADYYHAVKPEPGARFVISYSEMPDALIEEAVQRLTKAVQSVCET